MALRGVSREVRSYVTDLRRLPPAERRAVYIQDLGELVHGDGSELTRASTVEFGTPWGLWQDDPTGFVVDVLQESATGRQAAIYSRVESSPRVVVPSCFSSGKCLWENERVTLADGRMVRAGDLVGVGDFRILAYAEDGSQVAETGRATWNTTEPLWHLRTESGRTVVRNGNHPLRVAAETSKPRDRAHGYTPGRLPVDRGWQPVSSLRPGDLVLVPLRHEAEGTQPVERDHAVLLGYLLGDGGTTSNQITFTQQDGEALDEFQAVADRLGADLVPMSNRYCYRLRSRELRRGRHRVNPVLDLVREWGLFGKGARDKRFPDWAWALPNTQLRVVLGRLFACDGWAWSDVRGNSRRAQLAIALASEGLIEDVAAAMLRLGIRGTIRHRRVRYLDSYRDAWEWSTHDPRDIERAADLLDMPGKNAALQRAANCLADRTGAKGVRRWRERECPNGYRWERIASVEQRGTGRTVAIEVDRLHTFVTDLVEHNSHAAARLVVWWSCVWPVGSATTVTTATRMRQVSTQIWPHIARLVERHGLPGEVGVAQWRMPRDYSNDRGGELVAYGFTPPQSDPEAVQGVHNAHVLIEVDEGGGISVPMGQAWDSATTGGHSRLVVFGNPPIDEEDGWLERISRSRQWTRVPIRAEDTPNFTGEDPGPCRSCPDWRTRPHNVREHLISRQNVRDFIESHGADSPFVISKVHAGFPRGGAPKTIPARWVEMARVKRSIGGPDRDLEEARGRNPRIDLGVDVAEAGGDEMVVARAEGLLLRITHRTRLEANPNNVVVAGYILRQIEEAEQLAIELGVDLEQFPVRVKIDAIGVGWGVIGTLEAWGTEGLHSAIIVPVKGSETAEDPARFTNRRAEHWETLRELLQPKADRSGNIIGPGPVTLDIDEKAAHQLSTPKRENDSGGRIKVESVKSMSERGEGSPDLATALTLAPYNPPSLMPEEPLLGLIVG